MSRPDEGLIHAWLDGELDAAEASRVARLVETDAEWGAAAAEVRGLIAASSRIVGALDVVPGGVIPAGSKASGGTPGVGSPRRRRSTVRPWMRVAAGLVLVAGVGYVASRSMLTPAARLAGEADGTATEAGAARSDPVQPMIANERTVPAPPAASADAAGAGAAASGGTAAEGPREAAKASVMAGTASGALRESAAPIVPTPQTVPPAVVPAPAPVEAESRIATPAPTALRDSATLRRSLESARIEGVVVTGARGAAAAPASQPTAQLRPRQVIERIEPSPLAAQDAMATTGCWRVRTTAPMDTLLLEPRLTPERGDTLRLEVAGSSVTARVTFLGTTALNGTATEASGRRHPFAATRVSCP